MSNRFTKYTVDKLRVDGWLDKEQADQLRTQLKSVEAERDGYKHEAEMWDEHMGPLTDYEGDEAPWQTIVREFENLRDQRDKVEADAEVMRGAVELVIDAYSFVSGGSREPISTAMKRPENEMNVFRLVISLNNLKNKCESTNAGKSLLLRLQEAEWLLDHCPDSLDPNPVVNKQWWSRRDTFLNPKPQEGDVICET